MLGGATLAQSSEENYFELEAVTIDEEASRRSRFRTETDAGEETVRTADRVVVAVGREPVTDTVGLDAIGLEPGERGFIETDDQCRTDRDGVFAVGDVAGEPMLAHKASAEGEVAAETIAGREASMTDRLVPSVIFTDPEVATIGTSEGEAIDAGDDVAVGRMRFAASGRALAAERPEGFVRVIVDRESETLIGAQIVGDHASELVGELGLAVQNGLPAADVASAIHAHPTLSEAVMEACADAIGEAIHVPE
jgi:dihydrolipoamide dehydrogenase